MPAAAVTSRNNGGAGTRLWFWDGPASRPGVTRLMQTSTNAASSRAGKGLGHVGRGEVDMRRPILDQKLCKIYNLFTFF